ncbi:DUF7312 domain-containing protein [Halalkalicoccus subterraneus]|uniref:DUF7312 domain-containing protein n=1 Tax=Halalkalicoccus subterraneus TaxID=2675002 RepID=UPI000EFAEE6C|nr:hypothetical protein [Halalkalicoccus subterraneus]
MAAPEDGEDWEYSVEEVGENGDGSDEEPDRRIEPGSLDAENALFVALGVLIALGALAYGLGFI